MDLEKFTRAHIYSRIELDESTNEVAISLSNPLLKAQMIHLLHQFVLEKFVAKNIYIPEKVKNNESLMEQIREHVQYLNEKYHASYFQFERDDLLVAYGCKNPLEKLLDKFGSTFSKRITKKQTNKVETKNIFKFKNLLETIKLNNCSI